MTGLSRDTRFVCTLFFAFVLLVLLWLVWSRIEVGSAVPQAPVYEKVSCKGLAIKVEHAFRGRTIDEHSCAVQCDGNVPRYVLYSNGKATQCEALPGCNDWGEDKNIECIPPDQTSLIAD